jgi:2-polyprenyl-6-methoxyphenol hydroxylase-like FAD-dependent oxidoreductase
MTPFAGVGVNVGMTDALVLGREIIEACAGRKTLEEATKEYENEMVPRAAKFARKTLHGKETHFSASGAQDFADRLRSHHAAQTIVQGKE